MPILESINSVFYAIAFLVPGLIILFIRSQFITGRSPPFSEAALPYLTLSVIYYAVAAPFIGYISFATGPKWWQIAIWFCLIIVGPLLFGTILGITARLGPIRWLLQKIGLNPVHVVPTAWDWKFGALPGQCVLVVLKDGTKFAGHYGSRSFASSVPSERDLYIETVYSIEEDQKWVPLGQGVLIAAGEIRTIEFWPAEYPPKLPKENQNDERKQNIPADIPSNTTD